MQIDLNKYRGLWFEQRRLDSWFESGLDYVTANYGLVGDSGFLSVTNSGTKPDGSTSVSQGPARTTNTNGVLLVSFFPFVEGPYVVLYLEPSSYQMAVVGSPDRATLWLLTRNRIVTKDQLDIFSSTALATTRDLHNRQADLKKPKHKKKTTTMAATRVMLIMDDCEASVTLQNPAFLRLFMHGRNYNDIWYPDSRLWQIDPAVIKARREKHERATFLRAQLWQCLPVRDVLNIVACFYSSAFDSKSKRCIVLPPLAERIRMYQVMLDLMQVFGPSNDDEKRLVVLK